MPCALFPPSRADAEDSSWVAQIYKGACFRRNPRQDCVDVQAQSQCVGTFKLLWVRREQQVLWLQSLKRHVYFPCWHIPQDRAGRERMSVSEPAATWSGSDLALPPPGLEPSGWLCPGHFPATLCPWACTEHPELAVKCTRVYAQRESVGVASCWACRPWPCCKKGQHVAGEG